MHNHRKKANSMPLDAVTSALEGAIAQRNDRPRPLHYLTHFKVPGGPAYRFHLYICPWSHMVLSYRLEPEPVH
jgi:hypothetical protein